MSCLYLCSENYRLSRHDHLTCAKRSQYHRVLLPCNDLHHSNLKCVVLFQKVCIQYCLQFLLVVHPKLMDIPVPMGNQPLPPHYPRCAKVQLSIFLDTGIYALVVLLMCCCCKEYNIVIQYLIFVIFIEICKCALSCSYSCIFIRRRKI